MNIVGDPEDIRMLDPFLVQLTQRLGYDLHVYPLHYEELVRMQGRGEELGDVEKSYLNCAGRQYYNILVVQSLTESLENNNFDHGRKMRNVGGFCDYQNRLIYVNTFGQEDPEKWDKTLSHELGHAIAHKLGIDQANYLVNEHLANIIGYFLRVIATGDVTNPIGKLSDALMSYVGVELKKITKEGEPNK